MLGVVLVDGKMPTMTLSISRSIGQLAVSPRGASEGRVYVHRVCTPVSRFVKTEVKVFNLTCR